MDAVCREGPKAVLDLVQLGAQFTTNTDGSLHLTKEGGHSDRRIVHAADVTGCEIERALVAAARKHSNISFHEHHLAQDLLYDEVNGARHCLGADVFDQANNTMMRFVAPVTLLATGGAGQVYPNTTNPSVSTGDGMAMAFRAKAVMANMEFVQFHPTAFYSAAGPNSSGRTFLISEALRGEGGLLYNQSMERFMPQYDERLELAPRDVVARSIQDQMLKRGESHVLLDVSKESASKVCLCSVRQACCCYMMMICVHGGSDYGNILYRMHRRSVLGCIWLCAICCAIAMQYWLFLAHVVLILHVLVLSKSCSLFHVFVLQINSLYHVFPLRVNFPCRSWVISPTLQLNVSRAALTHHLFLC